MSHYFSTERDGEYQRRDQQLRNSELRYRRLFEATQDGILILDARTGTVIDVNPFLLTLLGYTRAEFVDRKFWEIEAFSELAVGPGAFEALRAHVQIREDATLHAKDGRPIQIEFAGNVFEVGADSILQCSIQAVTERKLVGAALPRRADEFEALAATARDLAGEQDLAPLLQTIIDRATLLLAVNSGAIYLYNPERGDLEIAHVQGLTPNIGSRLPMGEGAAGRAAQARQPLLINDYVAWEGKSARYSTLPVQSILCVPMVYSGELIGVLTVIELAGSTRKFSDSDVQLLSLFAGQVASAVHSARTLEQARRRADQLQTLNQVSQYITGALELGPLLRQVVTAMHKLLQLYYVSIAVVEGAELVFLDGESQRHAPLGLLSREHLKISDASLSGWVAQTGATFLAPDVSAEPRYRSLPAYPDVRSELVVPLRIQSQVIGVLDATSDKLNAFTPEQVSLVEALAAQVAVAIQNSRLFAETRGRLEELEAVNRVNAALRSAPTVEAMLPILLQVTLEILHATQGSIWLYHAAGDELRPVAMHGYGPNFGDPPLPPLKPGQGVVGAVYENGEAFVSRDFHTDPRVPETGRRLTPPGLGGAGIPIRAADTVIGVFIVRVPLPRVVAAGEVRLLTILSEIAGNAIQRSTLRQQTERRLQHLTALSEIDRVISSSFDLHLSLSVLLGHVTAQLGVDAADVLLFNAGSQMLEYAAARGFRGKAIERTRVRIGEGLAGRAVLEHRLIHLINQEHNQALGIVVNRQRAAALAGEGFVGYFCVPLMAKGKVKGVLEAYQRVPTEPDEEWFDFFKSLGERAAIAIDNVTLFDGLQRSNNELVLAYDATIEGWSRALDLRDKETEGHTQRAAVITVGLAREFGLSEDELVQVRWGALLHDIGKMGIPDNILLKAGPLSGEEWLVMKTHPVLGYEMLSPIRYLRSALDIPYRHHEKWDGSGYPLGLRGEQIPLAARIFAVVDVWDALRSDRPYRKGWPEKEVMAHIEAGAGTHFDPRVVELFLKMRRMLEAEREADERIKDEG